MGSKSAHGSCYARLISRARTDAHGTCYCSLSVPIVAVFGSDLLVDVLVGFSTIMFFSGFCRPTSTFLNHQQEQNPEPFSSFLISSVDYLATTRPARPNTTSASRPCAAPASQCHNYVGAVGMRERKGVQRTTEKRGGVRRFCNAKRAGRVVAQPREARLQPCPIACDTPVDGSVDTRLYGSGNTAPCLVAPYRSETTNRRRSTYTH